MPGEIEASPPLKSYAFVVQFAWPAAEPTSFAVQTAAVSDGRLVGVVIFATPAVPGAVQPAEMVSGEPVYLMFRYGSWGSEQLQVGQLALLPGLQPGKNSTGK